MSHLLVLVLAIPLAAGSLDDATQALARKIVKRRGETALLTVRSMLPGKSDIAALRAGLDRALRARGVRLLVRPPVDAEIRVTLSANELAKLLIAEVRRGEDRSVIIEAFEGAEPSPGAGRFTLEKRLVHEQENRILDAVLAGGRLIVLEPDAVVAAGARFPAAGSPPVRDPRGRIEVLGGGFRAHLPGLICTGDFSRLSCEPGATDYPVAAGTRATLAEGRNYFDGAAPFFTVAVAGEWVVHAGIDQKALISNNRGEPMGAIEGAGSDITAIRSGCGRGWQLLATRADQDALEAFEIVDGKPQTVSAPLEMPGRISAVWPGPSPDAALVVTQDGGRYAAYHVSLSCAR